MEWADSLSRKADWVEGVKRDNELLLIEKTKGEIIEKIKKSKGKDNKVVKMVEKIKKAEIKVLRNDE